ncbi:hypothetical protein OH799_13375 [Nocardia sp. NBC_00881]|nr:hypothetical protein OH799_13375 [Nocardia sp. NBC_00881]
MGDETKSANNARNRLARVTYLADPIAGREGGEFRPRGDAELGVQARQVSLDGLLTQVELEAGVATLSALHVRTDDWSPILWSLLAMFVVQAAAGMTALRSGLEPQAVRTP